MYKECVNIPLSGILIVFIVELQELIILSDPGPVDIEVHLTV